jgi:hypothetical protein
MTLAKTAAPYGGGRVVSLFAHKKFDFLTVEYLDTVAVFTVLFSNWKKDKGKLSRRPS